MPTTAVSDPVHRRRTLDGFAKEVAVTNGLNLRTAEPLVPILVTTRNSLYRIIPLRRDDVAVLVHGGRFFPSPAEARLVGSTFGGSVLKMHCIRVGMCMEIALGTDQGFITTTRVLNVEIERNAPMYSRPH
jgi:hypothetical protein